MSADDKPRPLRWRAAAVEDRLSIFRYIAARDHQAAIRMDLRFDARADMISRQPSAFKVGRMPGTREAVVSPSYVIVYRVLPKVVEVVRLLHTARQWPSPQ